MARAGFHPNRSVIEIADILRLHGQDYARVHAAHLGRVERRVMRPSRRAGRQSSAAMSRLATTAASRGSPTTPAAIVTVRSVRDRP
jgi:hypothetical protein